MVDCKVSNTSFASHFKLSKVDNTKSDEEKAYMSSNLNANIIGGLMYAMIYKRPNFAYPLSVLSRYMANLRKDHWEALK